MEVQTVAGVKYYYHHSFCDRGLTLFISMVSELSSIQSAFPSLLPGALAWNADQLSSGSRDRVILQRDIRAPPLQSERRLQGHRQEVCGLKWSTDHQLLASGGNDNKVCREFHLCFYEIQIPIRITLSCMPQNMTNNLPDLFPYCFNLMSVVACVEPLECPPSAAVHRALGCSEGHRLVTTPTRPAGLWRRHR